MVRPLKRALRVLLWVAVGLVVVLGAAYLLRVPLFGGLVKAAITSRLSDALGGRYEIDAVGGTWLSDLEVTGLRTVEAPADGPLVRLDADAARVRYDLLALLGDAPLSGIESVEVRGLEVDADPTRPARPAGEAEPPDLSVLEAFRGRVDVEGSVSVETGSGPASLEDLRISFGPMRVLDLGVGNVSLPERFAVEGPLAGRVSRVDERAWRWTSDAVLGGVRIPQATITADGQVRGVVEVAGGRVEVSLSDRTLGLRSEGLELAETPAWLGDLLPDDVPTAGRVGGTATVTLADPVAVSFVAAGKDVRWRDEVVTLFEAEGSWAGAEEVRVARLLLRAQALEVRAADATIDTRLPFLLRQVADLSVEVASTRRFLPDLERDLAVSLRAAGEGREIDLQTLSVVDAALSLRAEGRVTLPEDPEAWKETVLAVEVRGFVGDLAPLDVALDGRLDLRGRLAGTLDALRGTLAVEGTVQEQEIEEALLDATLTWPSLEVHRLQARAAGASLDARGRLALEPFAVPELAGTLDVPDLARVADLIEKDLPALAGRVRAEGRLLYTAEALDVSADLVAADVRVDEVEVGAVQATVRSEQRSVFVESIRAEGPWGHAHAMGEILPDEGLAAVRGLLLETEDLDLSLRAPLGVRWAEGEVAAQGLDLDVAGGRLTADAVVHLEDRRLEVWRIAYEAEALEVRAATPVRAAWSERRVELAPLALRLGEERTVRSLAPITLSFAEDVVAVDGLDVDVDGARLAGAGRVDLDAAVASVDRLELTKDDLSARLLSPATLRWPDGRLEVAGLDVETFGGRITGRAVLSDPPDVELEGRGFAVEQFVPRLQGDVAFRARAREGTWAVAAEVPLLGFQEWQGALSAKVRQRPAGGIEVVEVRLTGPKGGAIVGRATTPYRVSEAGLVRDDDFPARFELEGAIAGLSRFTELAQGPIRVRAVGDGEGISAEVRVDDVGLCDEESLCDDGIARLRIDREKVSATVALMSDELMSVNGRVALDRGFDWTRPETAADLLEHGRLDGELRAVVQSWKRIAEHAPGLKRLEGAASVTLAARGKLTDPHVRGDVRLENVAFAADTVIAPLEQVNAHLVWQDRTIRILLLEGLMGFAPFSIGGSAELALDRVPTVDLTLTGRNMQLLRTDYVRMRIDVDAAAKGPVNALAISGEGTVVDFLYRQPVTLSGAAAPGGTPQILLFEIRDPTFSKMTFDLGIRAPNTLRIRNNFVRTNASFEGRLGGTGERPEFEGRLWFRGGEIFLPATTLRRMSGDVVFTKEAPFRPRLQMTAQTRARGFEMGVQIAGALPDVHLYVFTEPRLDDEDALLMLATGSTSAELAEGGIAGQAFSILANVFGGSLITSRGGEGEPGELAFFERFDFQSDWQGTRIQEIKGEFQVTDRWFLKLERDRFEQTNLGLLWRVRFR